jgi:hypothetical protein
MDMAKRLAQQTAGTKQDVPTFDYSETDWRRIEATLSGLRNYTPPEVIRKNSLESAQRYRSQLLQPKPAQRRRAWQQIVRQCEKLKRTVAIVAEQRLTDSRADWPHEVAENVSALYDGQLKALIELQEIATAHVDFYLPRGTYDCDFPRLGFDMNKPHWKFHFVVLEIWVRLGGKLRFSRNSNSGEISGPLARYFLL